MGFASASQTASQAQGERRSFGVEPLVCSKAVNAGKLAGAVAARIREHGQCTISVIGPGPAYNALKAVIIATEYLKESHPNQRLAVTPTKEFKESQLSTTGRPAETAFLQLRVRPLPTPPAVDAPEIFVASGTNPGEMAGLIRQVIEVRSAATIGGMGPEAMSKALKGIMIAQTYLSESLDGGVLAASIWTEKFQENDEERVRMMMCCVRAPALPALPEAT